MTYRIASEIGCTVEYLADNMSVQEYTSWLAYLEIVSEEEKKALKRSRANAKGPPEGGLKRRPQMGRR